MEKFCPPLALAPATLLASERKLICEQSYEQSQMEKC